MKKYGQIFGKDFEVPLISDDNLKILKQAVMDGPVNNYIFELVKKTLHLQEITQFVSESVIPSIQAKGIGADKSAMSRIDRWKERGSKLKTARARKQELEREAQTIGEAEHLIDEKENETKNID